MIMLRFESTLRASRDQVWHWITDADALRAEMRPLLKMSVPKGLHSLASVVPGQPLFTSWLWLFGVLPLGTSRLTLTQITPGIGFIEESPMTAMRYWRHERRIEDDPEHPSQVRLIDELRVDPYFTPILLKLFLRLFFNNRHRVLRKRCALIPAPLPAPAAAAPRKVGKTATVKTPKATGTKPATRKATPKTTPKAKAPLKTKAAPQVTVQAKPKRAPRAKAPTATAADTKSR